MPMCVIYGVAERTLRDNIEILIDDGEVDSLLFRESTVITEDSMGRDHKTTIYNLEVLDKLGMCCFRKNRKAKEIRDKFNDVLVTITDSKEIGVINDSLITLFCALTLGANVLKLPHVPRE